MSKFKVGDKVRTTAYLVNRAEMGTRCTIHRVETSIGEQKYTISWEGYTIAGIYEHGLEIDKGYHREQVLKELGL